ncbi:velvet factor-domain-containing protein [Fomitopsis serialis]|uniref:velvet factor-domain-containing protein n=1 Tax=Fomitopsis serialis TaxID=139415 RepID=UPI00200799AF|nr:velvet factor-domain-containing protein [Neoantrodia serialis]KAH9933301.1 velvet factor-domain-containing protein [Neoantrodia serialis]
MLHILPICLASSSRQTAIFSGLPNSSAELTDDSVNFQQIYPAPTTVTQYAALQEGSGRHDCIPLHLSLRRVAFVSLGRQDSQPVEIIIEESELSQRSVGHTDSKPRCSNGHRNTPAGDKKSVTIAQAHLRASHSSNNPIRVQKGASQRSTHRTHPYSTAQAATKTTEPDPCSISKSYSLEIVQHPVKTAEFGDATLSRLPLAPPLIARLVVSDNPEAEIVDDPDLQFLVAQVSIHPGQGIPPVVAPPEQTSQANTPRLLYGNLVSSPHTLLNLQGRQGVYFLFPDVSVRRRGQYQLCVTLLRLPRLDLPEFMSGHSAGAALAQARSLPFDVLPREGYTAPGIHSCMLRKCSLSPSSNPLTQYFLQQGARMYAFSTPPPSSSYRG